MLGINRLQEKIRSILTSNYFKSRNKIRTPDHSIYIHPSKIPQELDDIWSSSGDIGSEVNAEHFVPFNEDQVLAVDFTAHVPTNSCSYFLIPGIVVGDPRRYNNQTDSFVDEDTRITLVKSIDKDLQERVKVALVDYGLDLSSGTFFW